MSYLPEFEVWRERQRELLREAEERRLTRRARKVREKPSVSLRGLAPGFAAMVRRFEGHFAVWGGAWGGIVGARVRGTARRSWWKG